MTARAGYQQYERSKILTASPAELTLFLYDGFIKFCNIAKMYMDKKNYPEVNKYIRKAERIIGELDSTLNFKYATAKDFDNIYKYVLERLHEANIKKDKEILNECTAHIRMLRETWKQIMEKNKENK